MFSIYTHLFLQIYNGPGKALTDCSAPNRAVASPQRVQLMLSQQKASAETLRDAVKTANDVQDYASRDLTNEILKAKEDRIDQIETEIEQFETLGREIYLSTRI